MRGLKTDLSHLQLQSCLHQAGLPLWLLQRPDFSVPGYLTAAQLQQAERLRRPHAAQHACWLWAMQSARLLAGSSSPDLLEDLDCL